VRLVVYFGEVLTQSLQQPGDLIIGLRDGEDIFGFGASGGLRIALCLQSLTATTARYQPSTSAVQGVRRQSSASRKYAGASA
jgi:hypothetical protein